MASACVDVAELLHVRDEPAALDREHEAVRGGVPPAPVAARPLQRVERAVDLQRVEGPRRELQLAPLHQAARVERPTASAGRSSPDSPIRIRAVTPRSRRRSPAAGRFRRAPPRPGRPCASISPACSPGRMSALSTSDTRLPYRPTASQALLDDVHALVPVALDGGEHRVGPVRQAGLADHAHRVRDGGRYGARRARRRPIRGCSGRRDGEGDQHDPTLAPDPAARPPGIRACPDPVTPTQPPVRPHRARRAAPRRTSAGRRVADW